ncbi:MAG TPA: L-threonylcarbamoyladenylate synthase [Rhabdochlamydiaceae bacterium]
MLRLSPTDIARAAEFLRKGQVIAFPTETVYGLGAPIFNPSAIAEIFSLKKRPADNPLIAHISDLAQLERIAIDIPPAFFLLANAFFPGPLTLVLKKHPHVPLVASAGRDSLAVRMPKNPIARSLIAAVGEPLVAPSANLSGKPSATSCDHVEEDFADKIAAAIDGGKTEIGIESTVLSLLHTPPLLLRPGVITQEQIETVLGCAVCVCEHAENAHPLSPGMKYRHYSPRTPLRLFSSAKALRSAAQIEEKPLVLTRFETFSTPRGMHFPLTIKELYSLLRLADAQQYSCILILCDEALLQDRALKNRLLRACGLDSF